MTIVFALVLAALLVMIHLIFSGFTAAFLAGGAVLVVITAAILWRRYIQFRMRILRHYIRLLEGQ